MNIILTSVEEGLADAWQRFCGDLPFVTVHRGSVFDLSCDAVVSPANSFGFMDGGIDMLYTQHFGWHVQERLQEAIREDHHGELLVGAAEIVETDDPDLPFLVAVPTMCADHPARQRQPVSGRAGGPAAGHARHVYAGGICGRTDCGLCGQHRLPRPGHGGRAGWPEHLRAAGPGGDRRRPAGAGGFPRLVGGRTAPAPGVIHGPGQGLAAGIDHERRSGKCS